MVNFWLQIHKITGPSTQLPVIGKVFKVFEFPSKRSATANPSPSPVTSACGWAVWHCMGKAGTDEEDGPRLCLAAAPGCRRWLQCPVPSCSPQRAGASCVRANHPKAHKAVDDLPPERRHVLWAADRELQPPKHFPFHRIDIAFRTDSKGQAPNPAPMKSTRALLPWAYSIQGSVLQGLFPNQFGKFPD